MKRTYMYMIINLLFLIILALLIYFIIYGIKQSLGPTLKNKKTTIAEVFEFSYLQSRKRSNLVYTVNGIRYYTSSSSGYDVIGTKYLIEYECSDPGKSNLLFHEPVFAKNEETIICVGEITRFLKLDKKHKFKFEYILDGESYKTWQILPPDYRTRYPQLAKGQKFEVEVWKKNYNRAILHLE